MTVEWVATRKEIWACGHICWGPTCPAVKRVIADIAWEAWDALDNMLQSGWNAQLNTARNFFLSWWTWS